MIAIFDLGCVGVCAPLEAMYVLSVPDGDDGLYGLLRILEAASMTSVLLESCTLAVLEGLVVLMFECADWQRVWTIFPGRACLYDGRQCGYFAMPSEQ